jgi:hypothetical protein
MIIIGGISPVPQRRIPCLQSRMAFPCPLDLVISARVLWPWFPFPLGSSGPGPAPQLRPCAADSGGIGIRDRMPGQGSASRLAGRRGRAAHLRRVVAHVRPRLRAGAPHAQGQYQGLVGMGNFAGQVSLPGLSCRAACCRKIAGKTAGQTAGKNSCSGVAKKLRLAHIPKQIGKQMAELAPPAVVFLRHQLIGVTL